MTDLLLDARLPCLKQPNRSMQVLFFPGFALHVGHVLGAVRKCPALKPLKQLLLMLAAHLPAPWLPLPWFISRRCLVAVLMASWVCSAVVDGQVVAHGMQGWRGRLLSEWPCELQAVSSLGLSVRGAFGFLRSAVEACRRMMSLEAGGRNPTQQVRCRSLVAGGRVHVSC